MSEISESEFKACTGGHTKICGSKYPKNKVPMSEFRGPNNTILKHCAACRAYAKLADERRRIKAKGVAATNKISLENNSKKGHCKRHFSEPIDINLLREDPNDANSKLVDVCKPCRDKDVETRIVKAALDHQLYSESMEACKNNESEFGYCLCGTHSNASASPHPKDKVPIDLFRMESDPTKMHTFCLHCRNHRNSLNKKLLAESMSEAKDKNLYACRHCRQINTLENQAKNNDGTISIYCHKCKKLEKKGTRNTRIKIQTFYKDLILERIINTNSSCSLCSKIFLKPEADDLIVKSLTPYQKSDGCKYVLYENIEISVTDFINKFSDKLELSIIQFDHMTEEEQRSKGVLKDHEKYEPKINSVSQLRKKKDVLKESIKCQHVCMECHVKETIKREKGVIYTNKSLIHRQKEDYVNNLKLAGCSSCGYKTNNLFRFLHMDHLDINDKIDCVGTMINNNFRTLVEVKLECKKCRILCAHCHKIHTDIQRKQGLFLPKVIDYDSSNDDDEFSYEASHSNSDSE